MTAWLLLVGAGFLAWALYLRGKLDAERLAHEYTESALAKTRADLESRLAASESLRHESLARAEEVIRGLRTEIESLLGDLRTCRDPAVVADRLAMLLGPGA